MLGPIVDDRTPIEPDHVGHLTGVGNRRVVSKSDPLKEPEDIELRLDAKIAKHVLLREVGHANLDLASELAEAIGKCCEAVAGYRLDVIEGGSLGDGGNRTHAAEPSRLPLRGQGAGATNVAIG